MLPTAPIIGMECELRKSESQIIIIIGFRNFIELGLRQLPHTHNTMADGMAWHTRLYFLPEIILCHVRVFLSIYRCTVRPSQVQSSLNPPVVSGTQINKYIYISCWKSSFREIQLKNEIP